MKRAALFIASTAIVTLASGHAYADDNEMTLIKKLQSQISAQQKQIALQQKQIDALIGKVKEQDAIGSQAPAATGGDRFSAESKTISQRLDAIEEKESATPSVEINPSQGLAITSADRRYAVRFAAYAQLDSHTFFNDHKSVVGTSTNTFEVRRARPIVDIKMTDYFNAFIMTDFGTGQARLFDAYGDFHPMPETNFLNARFGQFKAPLGLERAQSGQELPLIERSYANDLVPQRDEGVMLYGQAIPNALEYQAGIFNGAPDLTISNGQAGNAKDFDGRIFAHPFYLTGDAPLQALGAGLAGSYGSNHEGNSTTSELANGFLSEAQRIVFSYGSGTYANGDVWRLNPQLTYYYKSFGLMADYVEEGQSVQNGAHKSMLHNKAWEATAGYVLTGEKERYGGVRPEHDFDPRANQWGAFELVGRYSELDVDPNAFSFYASPSTSVSHAYEVSAGMNWYFNPAVKLDADFTRETFKGGATTGDRPNEDLLMTRVQLRY